MQLASDFFPPTAVMFHVCNTNYNTMSFPIHPFGFLFYLFISEQKRQNKNNLLQPATFTVDLSHSNLALAQVKNHAYYEEKTSI